MLLVEAEVEPGCCEQLRERLGVAQSHRLCVTGEPVRCIFAVVLPQLQRPELRYSILDVVERYLE